MPLSTYRQIAAEIAARIQAGHYAPGDPLPEPRTSEQAGHPSGAVRDALRLLQRHGWIEVGTDSAYHVTQNSPADDQVWDRLQQSVDELLNGLAPQLRPPD